MTGNIHMGDVPAEAISAIDSLLGNYVAALDWQDWKAWLGSFAGSCHYSVTSRQNAENNLPLCYMIDDCRARIEDRVKFITDVWASTIEPYRTRHVTQRLSVSRMDDANYRVLSNVVVMFTQNNDPSGVLVTGYYDDIVTVDGGAAVFASKTVYIDGTPARYLAYPL